MTTSEIKQFLLAKRVLLTAVVAGALAFRAVAEQAKPAAVPPVSTGTAVWRNIDPDHHLGGRMAAPGYLLGKVVMVDYRDYVTRESVKELPRVQELWQAYKSKPFVLLGSHNGTGQDGKARKVAARLNLTFPVYAGALFLPLEGRIWQGGHGIYVIDAAGRVVYNGVDFHRASEVVVTSLTDERAPRSVEQLRRFIDYELKNLPGRALVNLFKLKKESKVDFLSYDEDFRRLSTNRDVVAVARLGEASRKAKEFVPRSKGRAIAAADRIKGLIARYTDLKKSANPQVAQEAKNNLADLIWTEATLRAYSKGTGK